MKSNITGAQFKGFVCEVFNIDIQQLEENVKFQLAEYNVEKKQYDYSNIKIDDFDQISEIINQTDEERYEVPSSIIAEYFKDYQQDKKLKNKLICTEKTCGFYSENTNKYIYPNGTRNFVDYKDLTREMQLHFIKHVNNFAKFLIEDNKTQIKKLDDKLQVAINNYKMDSALRNVIIQKCENKQIFLTEQIKYVNSILAGGQPGTE